MVLWGNIKKKHPTKLKVSRTAMIPHKSHKYCAILDLSYIIQAKDQIIKSVNNMMTKMAPRGAMDQLGHVLDDIIHAYAKANNGEVIFAAKNDVKDGFWRCVAEEGEKWIFTYVFPQLEGELKKIVIPTLLQMGWTKSLGYFCTASETSRDMSEEYVPAKIDLLPNHKFLTHIKSSTAYLTLPNESTTNNLLKFMIEVYVDDCICVAIP